MRVGVPSAQVTASLAGAAGGPRTGVVDRPRPEKDRGGASVSATAFRDAALVGMVAKGHGREACAAFLGECDAGLMDRVAALGLPTPRDRPLRLGAGPRAWSLPDIQRLVDLWCGFLPGSRIAGLLGRSGGGVYAKARWLGLPRRPRAALLRGLPSSPALDAPAPIGFKRREFRWTVELEDDFADRWLSCQSHRGIARDYGISSSAAASKATRLQLPQRFGLTLFDDYRPERRAILAHMFAGWRRHLCNIRKRPFWTRHVGVVFSEEARKQATFRDASAVPH